MKIDSESHRCVSKADCISIGCGAAPFYPEEVWDGASELIRLLREGDAATRRKACVTLTGLVRQAQRRSTAPPELASIVNALREAQHDPDPEIRRIAKQRLTTVGE